MKQTIVLMATLFSATVANAQSFYGPYIGGYLAAGSGDSHWALGSGSKSDSSGNGGLGGVQGGFNWHRGNVLLGAQADFGVGSISGTSRCPSPNVTFDCKTDLFSLFSARGRVGPIFGPVAPYVTAGLASGGVRTSVDNHAGSHASQTRSHIGWAAGAGVTGRAARHMQWQLEYLHVDLASEEHVMLGVSHKVKMSLELLRVGVHYRFF